MAQRESTSGNSIEEDEGKTSNTINYRRGTSLPQPRIFNIENEDENEYKQIKAIRSYSEPNLLTTSSTSQNLLNANRKSIYSRQSANLYPYLKEFNNANSRYNGKKQYYSLFCLAPKNPIRALAILITESKYPFHCILVYPFYVCFLWI